MKSQSKSKLTNPAHIIVAELDLKQSLPGLVRSLVGGVMVFGIENRISTLLFFSHDVQTFIDGPMKTSCGYVIRV